MSPLEAMECCGCKLCFSARHNLNPHIPADLTNPALGICGNGTKFELIGDTWILTMRRGKKVPHLRALDDIKITKTAA